MQQYAWFIVSSSIASKYRTVPFVHVQFKKYTTRMHDEEAASVCTGVSTVYSPKLPAQGILTYFDSQQKHNTLPRQFRGSRSGVFKD